MLSRTGGDPDQAEIKVYFDDFVVESLSFDFEAPEEWYSEMHQDNRIFKFADGFYETAEKAVAAFSQKASEDMFGERYFPVIVFPKLKEDVARSIAGQAKSCSAVIIVGDKIILGTRCKSYEYQGVITDTYQNGGQVPIGVEWNWD